MVPSKGGPLYRQHKAPLSSFVACSSGFYFSSSFAEGVGTWPTPRSDRGGGSCSAHPLAGCLPPGAWEPVPLGQFEVTPFKLISPLTPTLLRETFNWAGKLCLQKN